MIRLKTFIMLVAVVSTMALEQQCQADPVYCLQFLGGTIGNPPTGYVYYEDEYTSPSPCDSTTFDGAGWVVETRSYNVPQTCSGPNFCLAASPAIATAGAKSRKSSRVPSGVGGADLQFPAQAPDAQFFSDAGLGTSTAIDSTGKTHTWHPAKGYTIISVRWILVSSPKLTKPIPVKVYSAQFDYTQTDLPADIIGKIAKPVRPIIIGFEVTKLPDGENPASRPVTSIGDRKYSGLVSLEAEVAPVIIFTHTAVQ